MKSTFLRVLTIAGSDSGGGAGIQADLKTFSALGCYGMSAITALTAQNTMAVKEVFPISADFVKTQIDAVFEDIGADAVKIGMLGNTNIIKAVAECLMLHAAKKIVLDPVMIAKSGDPLLHRSSVHALKENLIPIATLITPNIPETEVLIDHKLETNTDIEEAARMLQHLGAESVLIKGGHAQGNSCADYLLTASGEMHWFESPRIESKNTHGTGCTLSSAIAAYLAKGYPLKEAVSEAKSYISHAIEAAKDLSVGNGHGPVHHFHALW